MIVIYSIRICCFLQDKDKDKEFKVDWRRVGITSSFGFAFVGPVGHYWLVHVIWIDYWMINKNGKVVVEISPSRWRL